MLRDKTRGADRLRFLKAIIRRKMGALGVALVLANVLVAATAPLITPYDPIRDLQVADDYAYPAWMGAFPPYSDLPRDQVYRIEGAMWKKTLSGSLASSIELNEQSPLTVRYRTGQGSGEGKIAFGFPFDYLSAPPQTFVIRLPYNIPSDAPEGVSYRISATLRTPNGTLYSVFDSFPPWRSGKLSRWTDNPLVIHSRDIQVAQRVGVHLLQNVARAIFSQRGTYAFQVELTIRDALSINRGAFDVVIATTSFRIPGLLHGLLGTNRDGADVFSQYVYGARVSLQIGLLAVSVIVLLGLVAGVVAGYRGGFVDRFLVFTSDVVIQIPGIPVILLVLLFLGRSIYNVIFVIALLSWAGLARQIRSWVLSLRERAFVEAARAAGAKDLYIMFRVIAPQTMPIIAVSLALGIPAAIFTEAGISILGFGDPAFPSWGKIINESLQGGGVAKLAWWWVAPPIIGILSLAMGFVFIGYTLDEMLNPRLRRTR